MKKVYLSFPIETLSDTEIEDTVNELIEAITSEIREAIEASYNVLKRDLGIRWFGKSINNMVNADIVCFAKGWEDSKKCKLEHNLCVNKYYGKSRMYIKGGILKNEKSIYIISNERIINGRDYQIQKHAGGKSSRYN